MPLPKFEPSIEAGLESVTEDVVEFWDITRNGIWFVGDSVTEYIGPETGPLFVGLDFAKPNSERCYVNGKQVFPTQTKED